jgi:hypothetical protein
LNFDFDSDPDPDFDFDADPDLDFHSDAYPDPASQNVVDQKPQQTFKRGLEEN